ncbi:MAG: EFR1 family ferrodoxin [Pleomorphochaeta sp.]
MKDLIVCFSGTGNSFYVANEIAKSQNHNNIIMLNELSKDNFQIPERLGFVFPIHISREPLIFEKILREVLSTVKDFTPLKFVYAISTAASNSPGWAHIRLEKTLKDFGIATTYVNHVKLPRNYAHQQPQEKIDQLFSEADVKIKSIINDIENEKIKFPKFKIFTRTFTVLTYFINKNFTNHYSSEFEVTEDCINCKLCYRSCPANNITMENGKPVFHDNCYACSGCINTCPTNAIIKKKDDGKRYKNPKGNFNHLYRS